MTNEQSYQVHCLDVMSSFRFYLTKHFEPLYFHLLHSNRSQMLHFFRSQEVVAGRKAEVAAEISCPGFICKMSSPGRDLERYSKAEVTHRCSFWPAPCKNTLKLVANIWKLVTLHKNETSLRSWKAWAACSSAGVLPAVPSHCLLINAPALVFS